MSSQFGSFCVFGFHIVSFFCFFLGGGVLLFKFFWLKANWRVWDDYLRPDGQVQNGLNQNGCVSNWYELNRMYLIGYNNYRLVAMIAWGVSSS